MMHPGEYDDDEKMYMALIKEQRRTGSPVVAMPQYQRDPAPLALYLLDEPEGKQQCWRAVWGFIDDHRGLPSTDELFSPPPYSSRTSVGTFLGQVERITYPALAA